MSLDKNVLPQVHQQPPQSVIDSYNSTRKCSTGYCSFNFGGNIRPRYDSETETTTTSLCSTPDEPGDGRNFLDLSTTATNCYASTYTIQKESGLLKPSCRPPRHLMICLVLCISLATIGTSTGIYLSSGSVQGELEQKIPGDEAGVEEIKNGSNSKSQEMESIKSFPTYCQTSDTAATSNEAHGEGRGIIVQSVQDLRKLIQSNRESGNAACQDVTIYRLAEIYDKSLVKFNDTNVKNLTIAGPITEAWLECLLKRFSGLESLTIDAEKLCIAQQRKDNQLVPLTLDNVKKLRVENSHSYICLISSWIFTWRIPHLKSLSIHASDLTEETFNPVKKFLHSHRKTLETIVIEKSYLCDDCTYEDISFDKLRRIELLDMLTSPLI